MATLANATAIAMCNAAIARIATGSGVAHAIVYDGDKPADSDTAVTDQVALIDFPLPDDVFPAPTVFATKVTSEAITISPVTASNTGEATWARIYNKDGDPVYDVVCSAVGGGGEMQLATTSVVENVESRILLFLMSVVKGITTP